MTYKERIAEVIKSVIIVFIVGMFGIFPLYYEDAYFNMGEAKYHFAKYFAMAIFFIIFIVFILYLTASKNVKKVWKPSLTDCFVGGYTAVVLISYLLTPYKETAFWGYEGWYMGLFSQILFVLIYYFVSRFYRWENFLLIPILGSSAIVFLLAVFHRFQIDPLGMYEGVAESQYILFLTTIGQATWYSSYLCIVLPIGMYIYWVTEHRIMRILTGCYVALGFMTVVTQNSDSAFLSVAAVLLVIFSFSMKENKRVKRFLEIVMIGSAAFQIIGILQKMFPENAMLLEPLSMFFSQSNTALLTLCISLLLYLALGIMEKKRKFQIEKLYILVKVVWISIGVSLFISLILIYLTTTHKLPEGLAFLKDIGYFTFDSNWGSGRGFSWKTSMMIFKEFPFVQKIFGCGPDCFAPYSYEFYGELLASKWGDTVLTNAHNEWMTSLLFFGVFGFLTYGGIFVSQIIKAVQNVKENRYFVVIVMCIAAYMVHNFFCYQQIVCTPLIFIIIGAGESMMRRKGNAL